MNLGDLLKSFAIDTWYKAVMYLGAVVFVVSLFVEVKGITNAQLQLLSAGAFFVGLGEWKNYKVASGIKRPNAYSGGAALIGVTIRRPDPVGIMLDLVGVLLVGLATLNMVAS